MKGNHLRYVVVGDRRKRSMQSLNRVFSRLFASTGTDNESVLCSTCASLDITAILRNGSPKNKIPLGHLVDILDKVDQCRFCNLLGCLFRRNWSLDTLPNADLSPVVCSLYAVSVGALADPDLPERKQCHRLRIKALPRPQEVSDVMLRKNMDLSLEIQLLEEDAPKVRRGREVHGRRMADTADMRLLKSWLALCEHEHGDVCASVWWRGEGVPLPPFLRMVDITDMALVQAPPDCRYIALSYVWGAVGNSYWTVQANIDARLKPGGLDLAVLPATIADAVHVVRELGERYLWVDALCIIQDSPKDKGEQIHAMDLVYGNAVLTIFAASGESALAGLPGVLPGSRSLRQHIEVIQGLHLALPLPSLKDVLLQSTWDTRGWTFQELLLSRRRLFFTDHQVYFDCSKDVWCEDLIAESKTLRWSDHPMRHLGSGAKSFLYEPTFPYDFTRSYANAVARYTQRRLTYPSNVILAITALINTMAKAYKLAGGDPARAFRYGIQIQNLEHMLLWQPRLGSEHVRRVDPNTGHSAWPSWAWSGWIGAAAYSSISQFTTTLVTSDPLDSPAESLVKGWYLVDDERRLVRLDVEQIRFGRIGNRVRPPAEYVSPPGDIDAHALGELPPAGTLVFRTQSASLRVSRLALGDPASTAPHAIFEIVSDDAQPISMGRMILPSTTPSPSVLECVVVVRFGIELGLYNNEVYGSYEGGLLYVMAVRRAGEVRERVGLGVIAEQAWLGCDAKVETIFLR